MSWSARFGVVGLVWLVVAASGCSERLEIPSGLWVAALQVDTTRTVTEPGRLVLSELFDEAPSASKVIVGYRSDQLHLDFASPPQLDVYPPRGCGPFLPEPSWVSEGFESKEFESSLEADWFVSTCTRAPVFAEVRSSLGTTVVSVHQDGCRFDARSAEIEFVASGALDETGIACIEQARCSSDEGEGVGCGDACCVLEFCREDEVPCDESPTSRVCRALDTNTDCGRCGVRCAANERCRTGRCRIVPEPPPPPPPPPPPIDSRALKVAVGEALACALRGDRRVLCWRAVSQPEVLGVENVDAVWVADAFRSSSYDDEGVYVLTDGQLRFGRANGSTTWVRDGVRLAAFATGWRSFCVYDGTEISCTEIPTGRPSRTFNAPNDLVALAVGFESFGVAGLDSQGRVHVIDDEIVTLPGSYVSVAVSSTLDICALSAAGRVSCYDPASAEVPTVIVEEPGLRGFDATGQCVWGDSGAWCWGAHPSLGLGRQRDVQRVDWVDGARGLAISTRTGCVIDESDRVRCWGADSVLLGFDRQFGAYTPVELAEPATSIFAGYDQMCATVSGGETLCWGRDVPARNARRIEERGVLTGGLYARCSLDPQKVVDCVSYEGLSGETSTSRGGFSRVYRSYSGVLAVADDFAIHYPYGTLIQLPPRTNRVAGGQTKWCVLGAGQVACSTRSDRGIRRHLDVPGHVVDVDVGFRNACAASEAGAFCWGDDNKPERLVAGSFELVRSSFNGACFIDTNKELWCFGENVFGLVEPSTSVGRGQYVDELRRMGFRNVVDIADDIDSRCALDRSGEVWCWGSNARCQLGKCDPYHRALAPPISLDR